MPTLEQRPFGNTGLAVPALGFGGGHIGGDEVSDAQAVQIIHRTLDLGITLLDTARGYGRSEERIGHAIHSRRHEVVLSTKIGYGVAGFSDWTADIIPAGVTEALRVLQTDYLDIVHLHSCSVDVLENSGVVEALQREQQAGRIRVAAYSGDNDSLIWAVNSGAFGSIQCSFSICDQRILETALPTAIKNGLGVIAKRPIANAPWRYSSRPAGAATATNWDRFNQMGLRDWSLDWADAALRFTAFTPGIHSSIVGTRNPMHLEANVASLQNGPLAPDLASSIRAIYRQCGNDWHSTI